MQPLLDNGLAHDHNWTGDHTYQLMLYVYCIIKTLISIQVGESLIYIGIMIIYTKITVRHIYIYIFLGGTSNNIILDLHAEGKASHMTHDIEECIEQLTGETAAIIQHNHV